MQHEKNVTQKIQHGNSATCKKCNMKRVQHEESASKHGKSATQKKCNMRKAQRQSKTLKKSAIEEFTLVRKGITGRPLTDRYTLVFWEQSASSIINVVFVHPCEKLSFRNKLANWSDISFCYEFVSSSDFYSSKWNCFCRQLISFTVIKKSDRKQKY